MKKLTMLFSLLCLTLALTVPASALEYNIDGPGDPEYGKSTSIEPVATAGVYAGPAARHGSGGKSQHHQDGRLYPQRRQI